MVFRICRIVAQPFNKRGGSPLPKVRQGCCTSVLTPALLRETVQACRVQKCALLCTNTRLVWLVLPPVWGAYLGGCEEGMPNQIYVVGGGAEANKELLVGVCRVLCCLVDRCCAFYSMSGSKPLDWLSDRGTAGYTNGCVFYSASWSPICGGRGGLCLHPQAHQHPH